MPPAPLGPVWIAPTAETPMGWMWVAVSDRGLAAVAFKAEPEALADALMRRGFSPVTISPEQAGPAARQVEEFLQGERLAFDLPVDLRGLPAFQQRVLQATLAVPRGQVRTYAEIASTVGSPKAARAVGRAEATNPIPLVVPCHRIVGSGGGLHGYGGPGGIPTKIWLLNLEGFDAASLARGRSGHSMQP
jgi:methylated-DNA-[protein]-cysteine S-methyltransferase